MRAMAAVTLGLVLVACGGSVVGGDAASDAASDAGAADGGRRRCAAASECDDRDFCTGTEDCVDNFCDPGTPPCRADQTCDPATATCGEGCTNFDDDGYTTCQGDCDDRNNTIHPGAFEQCDGVDDDCNPRTFGTRDEDGDGFDSSECFNVDEASGTRYEGDDCDDTNDSVHRTAPEVCDGVDNNCDLETDESLPLMRCYRDEDGDAYGVTSMSEMRCSCGGGWATLSGDCHDGNANVHPGVDWQAGTYCLPSSPSCFVGGPGSSADWNCDGTQERRYNGVLAFVCGSTSGRCARMVDWVDGSFPSCGVAESARICNEDCTVTTRVLPQECR